MSTPSTNVDDVLVELIDHHPLQPRLSYDDAELDELADSIQAIGLINPITIQHNGDRYVIITGSRRLEAYKRLNRQFISAIILPANYASALNFTAHENLYRSDLSPVEEAIFFKRLHEENDFSQNQIAHLIKKPESYVAARLTLYHLPDYLKQPVHDRALPISHALELAKIENEDARQSYTQYAISTGASLATIRYWRQQIEATATIPTTGDTPPTLVRTSKQQTAFGWYCTSCSNFAEAQTAKTFHFCPSCAAELIAQLQKLRP